MKTTNKNIKGTIFLAQKVKGLKTMLKPVFILLVFVLWGNFTIKGQVTVDATSSGFTGSNVTTISVSHTTGTALNMLMLVGVSYRENQTMSVSYGEDPLELVGVQQTSANARTAIFKLINPPSGTDNVIVTASGNFDKGGIVGVMTFSGVDINTPLNTYASASGTTANPTLSNIATATNELVFSVVAVRDRDITGMGTNQTSRWNIQSGDEMRGAGSTKPGDGTTTSVSYTAVADDWSLSAVSIKPTPIADLQITKSVNNLTPYIGQTITFTLTATNAGDGISQNTSVSDLLPAGYTYSSHSTATGTYNAGTGIWDIGTMNSGATATLTINAVVNASGSYANTATITGDVIDNTMGNNTATQSITACQAGGTAPLFNQ
jgi:uncharacterized repeat protein (TIGR01451 family)